MPQDETFVPIHNMDEWDAFCSANAEALEEIAGRETHGQETYCYRLALNCQLLIGGGASPLFRVGFVDE